MAKPQRTKRQTTIYKTLQKIKDPVARRLFQIRVVCIKLNIYVFYYIIWVYVAHRDVVLRLFRVELE